MTAHTPVASARSGLVRPFAAMGIVAEVGRMQRAGRNTIAMCLGEPTQGAPTPVLRRAAEVTRDGTGLGYRSEERRVGKECSPRWSARQYQEKKHSVGKQHG